ncbi:MAG TPA: glycine zipper 2TM domain-containing protein [Hyphomonadaceae bacterium]|nr:glycine zipper 2TM domain-containing protein [Hyphomonadaceae bacterium]
MRKVMLKSAAMMSALVMGTAAVACSPATNGPQATADSAVQTSSNDAAAQKIKYEQQKAREAQARADAAQAKLDCEHERQEASNKGAVVGGLTGAVLGSQVAGHGAKSEGAVIGGVGGVLAGRQIAKKDHRC